MTKVTKTTEVFEPAFRDVPADGTMAPKRTRLQEFWQIFRQNRLAIIGLIIFILFFFTALAGLFLTSGQDPVLDPALVRLQEKLRPPLSRPHLDTLKPDEIPGMGLYLLGTDNLGRDVFARMLQGAWVSLTVGFVAVGIAVLIGIFMGGIAGYFGHNHVRVDYILVTCILCAGGVLLAVGAAYSGAGFLIIGHAFFFSCFFQRKQRVRKPRRNG